MELVTYLVVLLTTSCITATVEVETEVSVYVALHDMLNLLKHNIPEIHFFYLSFL